MVAADVPTWSFVVLIVLGVLAGVLMFADRARALKVASDEKARERNQAQRLLTRTLEPELGKNWEVLDAAVRFGDPTPGDRLDRRIFRGVQDQVEAALSDGEWQATANAYAAIDTVMAIGEGDDPDRARLEVSAALDAVEVAQHALGMKVRLRWFDRMLALQAQLEQSLAGSSPPDTALLGDFIARCLEQGLDVADTSRAAGDVLGGDLNQVGRAALDELVVAMAEIVRRRGPREGSVR